MKIVIFSIIFLIISCNQKQNELESQIQAIQFEYIDWSCACANWAKPADVTRYKDTGHLADHCIFIEPADNRVALPDTLGYNGDMIEFTGQFYKNRGYAKGYEKTEEHMNPAKIFRYTKFSVKRSMYKEFKKELGK